MDKYEDIPYKKNLKMTRLPCSSQGETMSMKICLQGFKPTTLDLYKNENPIRCISAYKEANLIEEREGESYIRKKNQDNNQACESRCNIIQGC